MALPHHTSQFVRPIVCCLATLCFFAVVINQPFIFAAAEYYYGTHDEDIEVYPIMYAGPPGQEKYVYNFVPNGRPLETLSPWITEPDLAPGETYPPAPTFGPEDDFEYFAWHDGRFVDDGDNLPETYVREVRILDAHCGGYYCDYMTLCAHWKSLPDNEEFYGYQFEALTWEESMLMCRNSQRYGGGWSIGSFVSNDMRFELQAPNSNSMVGIHVDGSCKHPKTGEYYGDGSFWWQNGRKKGIKLAEGLKPNPRFLYNATYEQWGPIRWQWDMPDFTTHKGRSQFHYLTYWYNGIGNVPFDNFQQGFYAGSQCSLCERSRCNITLNDCDREHSETAHGWFPNCTCVCKPGYHGRRCEFDTTHSFSQPLSESVIASHSFSNVTTSSVSLSSSFHLPATATLSRTLTSVKTVSLDATPTPEIPRTLSPTATHSNTFAPSASIEKSSRSNTPLSTASYNAIASPTYTFRMTDTYSEILSETIAKTGATSSGNGTTPTISLVTSYSQAKSRRTPSLVKTRSPSSSFTSLPTPSVRKFLTPSLAGKPSASRSASVTPEPSISVPVEVTATNYSVTLEIEDTPPITYEECPSAAKIELFLLDDVRYYDVEDALTVDDLVPLPANTHPTDAHIRSGALVMRITLVDSSANVSFVTYGGYAVRYGKAVVPPRVALMQTYGDRALAEPRSLPSLLVGLSDTEGLACTAGPLEEAYDPTGTVRYGFSTRRYILCKFPPVDGYTIQSREVIALHVPSSATTRVCAQQEWLAGYFTIVADRPAVIISALSAIMTTVSSLVMMVALLLGDTTALEMQMLVVLLSGHTMRCASSADSSAMAVVQHFVSPFISLGPMWVVVGNVAVNLMFLALHYGLVKLAQYFIASPSNSVPGGHRTGYLFPGLSYMVSQMLYMGTAVATMELICVVFDDWIHHRRPWVDNNYRSLSASTIVSDHLGSENELYATMPSKFFGVRGDDVHLSAIIIVSVMGLVWLIAVPLLAVYAIRKNSRQDELYCDDFKWHKTKTHSSALIRVHRDFLCVPSFAFTDTANKNSDGNEEWKAETNVVESSHVTRLLLPTTRWGPANRLSSHIGLIGAARRDLYLWPIIATPIVSVLWAIVVVAGPLVVPNSSAPTVTLSVLSALCGLMAIVIAFARPSIVGMIPNVMTCTILVFLTLVCVACALTFEEVSEEKYRNLKYGLVIITSILILSRTMHRVAVAIVEYIVLRRVGSKSSLGAASQFASPSIPEPSPLFQRKGEGNVTLPLGVNQMTNGSRENYASAEDTSSEIVSSLDGWCENNGGEHFTNLQNDSDYENEQRNRQDCIANQSTAAMGAESTVSIPTTPPATDATRQTHEVHLYPTEPFNHRLGGGGPANDGGQQPPEIVFEKHSTQNEPFDTSGETMGPNVQPTRG